MSREQPTFWQRLRAHLSQAFTLVILNPVDLAQLGRVQLRRSYIYSGLLAILVLVAGTTLLLVMYTPLRHMVPGYPTDESRARQQQLVVSLHRMEARIAQQDSFIRSMQRMSGFNVPDSVLARTPSANLPSLPTETLEAAPQASTEAPASPAPAPVAEQAALPQPERLPLPAASSLHLVRPVEGVLTRRYNYPNGHYAIDLAARADSPIRAISAGFVLFAEYTNETGWCIGVLHPNEMVSFYKHNRRLLKEVGDYVFAGEAIAVIGNSGENSTGPHLHFELWHAGRPVDPLSYFSYQDEESVDLP